MSIVRKNLLLVAFAVALVGLVLCAKYGVYAENVYKTPQALETKEDRTVIALYIGSSTALVNDKETQIDPNNPEVKPYIKDSRTLAPLRFSAESIGAKVDWDESTQTITITKESKKIIFVVGSKKVIVDGNEMEIDVAPEIKNDRTFVPYRKMSEALGKKVFYDRGLIVLSDVENIYDPVKDKGIIDKLIGRINKLPLVGSFENLEKILEKNNTDGTTIYAPGLKNMQMNNSANESSKAESSSQDSARTGTSEYSTTNIQVEGVDESDIVKNDGEYIYHVNKNTLKIFKAYPVDDMKIISNTKFEDSDVYPTEIYIQGNKLVVLGHKYMQNQVDMKPKLEGEVQESMIMRMPPYYRSPLTKAIVFDITDKANIKRVREVEIEGNMVSTRMIDSTLYIVANRYMNYYICKNYDSKTPMYKDSASMKDYEKIDIANIAYFPESVDTNYLIIGAFDVNSNDKVNIDTYLGSGNTMYVSNQHLYVAVAKYNYLREDVVANDAQTGSDSEKGELQKTLVYKFSLNGSNVTYINKCEVPGVALNQFSMDEYDGFFRIATTRYKTWENTTNNIYVLSDTMNIAGKLENLAPGEKIYSVRFMGKRAYMVTFKQVDPLFVIDFSEPLSPKVLGKLKIPGFSDYLHPYDENHIIGFGKDTEETSNFNNTGTVTIPKGLKLALFDVSDVSNPVQKFVEIIGDKGSDSEVLRNHKALLFDKNKNLLALPVYVVEKSSTTGEYDYNNAFTGAYVYNLDLKNGFKLKGKISHKIEVNNGQYVDQYDRYVQRILYIKDVLYTLSNASYKANDMETLKELKTINAE